MWLITQIGFLRRNLKTSNGRVKSNAYFTLVRPHLEYCSSVWNPHTADLSTKIEQVQRRAARYVSNDYQQKSSVTAMLQKLQWETLESRRTKGQLTMLYKTLNDLVDIQPAEYVRPNTG